MKILLVALVLLASQGAEADTLSGRVVGVADGDTVTVLEQKHDPGALGGRREADADCGLAAHPRVRWNGRDR